MGDDGNTGDLPTVSGVGGSGPSGPDEQRLEIEGYEITGLLGRGGMGTVWRAVQQSTRRQVALKLLASPAFASAKARVRFEREVELAARLEHPHIARVYDSGLYHGAYYYVMELVDGARLDEYVERNGLGRQQILGLVRSICRAVQHAHQRGVIHRDLKPSNILVTEDGQPHVLDLGVAKSFLEEDVGVTVSEGGDVVGTPAYMSPEQAAGKTDQIDTRSDVYSLGVILYRLLTGEFPHDLTGTRYEVLRRIAEEEPKPPRGTGKGIDRELKALLLKALAHDPDGRYASAGDLADDVNRYLVGEPLSAKAPTTVYFLRKRLRKHRVPTTILCVAAVALAALAVWSYVRIAQEADKARTVFTLVDDTIALIGPANEDGRREVTAHDVLDEIARRVDMGFSGQPLRKAGMLQGLGAKYMTFADYKGALRCFSAAEDIRRGQRGEKHPDTLASMHSRANALRLLGRAPEAERLLGRVLESCRSVLGNDHHDTLRSMSDLAKALFVLGKRAESEALARQTLEMSRRALKENHPTILVFTADLAKILWARGKLGEAELLYRQVLEARQQVLDEDHPDTLSSMDDLANALGALGERDEALRLYRKAAKTRERVWGEDHPVTVKSLTTLANALIIMDRRDEAEPIHEQLLELRQRAAKRWVAEALASMNDLANNYRHRRRYTEAEELHREGLRLGERFLGKEHPLLLTIKSNLANDLYQLGRFRQAEALHREVLEPRVRTLSKAHEDTLLTMLNLANAQLRQRKYEEAEMRYREVLEIGKKVTGARVRHILRPALKGLILALEARGKKTEAEDAHKEYSGLAPQVTEEAREQPDETAAPKPDGG